MGKIFGISDLPVSTIMTPFEPISVPQPPKNEVKPLYDNSQKPDVFVSKELPAKKTKSFLNMRNGIGRLMKSFSKKLVK